MLQLKTIEYDWKYTTSIEKSFIINITNKILTSYNI